MKVHRRSSDPPKTPEVRNKAENNSASQQIQKGLVKNSLSKHTQVSHGGARLMLSLERQMKTQMHRASLTNTVRNANAHLRPMKNTTAMGNQLPSHNVRK